MQSAIDNAVAYASPNKPEKFGGTEKVRTFLLHDLTAARRRIVQLKDVDK
jgi:hypothetical protein